MLAPGETVKQSGQDDATNDGPSVTNTCSASDQNSLRLRVYYEFERPRNGVQCVLSVPLPVTGSQILNLLRGQFDDKRYSPHHYDGNAECFVPIRDDTQSLYWVENALSTHSRIDIKLVQFRPIVRAEALLCDSSQTELTGGWFGIGIVRGKTASNHGSLWRSALQFGASMTFTIGERYEKKVEGSADIYKTHRQVPCIGYENVAAFMTNSAVDAQVVAIEYGGEDLGTFVHPKRALYVLGSEDCGVPPALVSRAHQHVAIPTAQGRPSSLNVAAAGAIVLYDRYIKMLEKKNRRVQPEGPRPAQQG